uniref:Amine oxidase domain-containing protein n=1 Tax=Lotharella globosa TaxID=91324 RepID=A0A7S3Z058_9EUKA
MMKCSTNKNGHVGVGYLYPHYKEVRALLAEYELEDQEVEINRRRRPGLFREARAYAGAKEKPGSLNQWIFNESETKSIPSAVLKDLTPEILHSTSLYAKSRKYIKLHQRILGDYKYSLPGKPANMKEINMTFNDFLEKNKLEELVPFFTYTHSALGYGLIDEVPALYGLWWNTPELIDSFFDLRKRKNSLSMMRDGFSLLWDTIVEKHDMDIIYNCDIKKITRNEKGVVVTTNVLEEPTQADYERGSPRDDDDEESESIPGLRRVQTMTFDFLIVAAPADAVMKCMDSTDKEKEIFSSLRYYTLSTTLYESRLREKELPVKFYPKRISQPYVSHMVRNSTRALNSWRPSQKKDRKVAYQFTNYHSHGMMEDKLRLTLIEDLRNWQENDIRVFKMMNWQYFPHFPQEAINKGYPWEIRKMQGENRTWYIGSSVCFESLHDCVRHNLDLMKYKHAMAHDDFSLF